MSRISQIALRAGLGTSLLLAILYAGDYASLKYRIWRFQRAGNSPTATTNPLETMQIEPTYAIPHKDGRAEFAFGPPETVTCAHSLFPHIGYGACWYVKRNSQKPIPM
jgi:hypothetical protein